MLKRLELETIVICLKLRAKLKRHFLAQSGSNLVFWNETWHTTLFSKYYCAEMVRIKKDSHMLEITC